MASDTDMSSWTDLLHSSSKLVEQAAPSAQFPPLQRNLDQLEALSKKLKSKTLRTEAPSQSIAATRLLAREGLNAEQLARDLKSFELKDKVIKRRDKGGRRRVKANVSLLGIQQNTCNETIP